MPWSQADVPAADRGRLRERFGALVATMHQVTGPAFGYPSESTGPLRPDWNAAFTGMMTALLADAVRFGAELPVSAQRVRWALAAAGPDLARVREPVLVHFDLWDGNVLIAPAPVTPEPVGAPAAGGDLAAEGLAAEVRISGIIDGERSLWGDPVIDFASTALLAEIRDDADFVRGYRSSGAPMPLTGSGRRRLLLYRVYLGLIMTIEPIPRRYGDERPDKFSLRIREHLVADLAELEELLVAPQPDPGKIA